MAETSDDFSDRVFKGGMWVGVLKSVKLVLKILEKIIYARLLVPDDFGIFAIAIVYLEIINTFSGFKLKSALVQDSSASRDLWDSVWTVRILKGLAGAALLIIFAPTAGLFFDDPRAVPIIQVLGIVFFLSNLENIGVIEFEKELRFKRYFQYEIMPEVLSAAAGLTIAFLYQTVWALVISSIAGWVIKVLISYGMHSYRPSWNMDFSRLSGVYNWGKWSMIGSILFFFTDQADDLFIGSFLGMTALGYYSLSFSFAKRGISKITSVINQVAFPAFSKLLDDRERLRRVWAKTFNITALVNLWIALGIYLYAEGFVYVFLGEKWEESIELLQILSLSTLLVATASNSIFKALGEIQLNVLLDVTRVIVIFSLIYPFSLLLGIEGAALAVLSGSLAFFILWSFLVSQELETGWRFVLGKVLPFLIVGLCTGFTMLNLKFLFADMGYRSLFVKVFLYTVLYCSFWVGGSWVVKLEPVEDFNTLLTRFFGRPSASK